jgi:hypothetical protein
MRRDRRQSCFAGSATPQAFLRSRRNLWLMVEPKPDLEVYGMPRKLRIRDAFGRDQSKSG